MNQNFSVFRELGIAFRNICNQFLLLKSPGILCQEKERSDKWTVFLEPVFLPFRQTGHIPSVYRLFRNCEGLQHQVWTRYKYRKNFHRNFIFSEELPEYPVYEKVRRIEYFLIHEIFPFLSFKNRCCSFDIETQPKGSSERATIKAARTFRKTHSAIMLQES